MLLIPKHRELGSKVVATITRPYNPSSIIPTLLKNNVKIAHPVGSGGVSHQHHELVKNMIGNIKPVKLSAGSLGLTTK